MKYSIFKNTPKQGDQINLYNTFNLDSFNKELRLDPEQIINILDEFKWEVYPNTARIMEYLISYLFENMGGSNETPTNEVMSFMYVLLNSPAFKFKEFLEGLQKAVNIDNIFRYIVENDFKPPEEYITLLQKSISCDPIFNVLRTRHSFQMTVGSTSEQVTLFIQNIEKEIFDYMEGAKSIENNFNHLLDNN